LTVFGDCESSNSIKTILPGSVNVTDILFVIIHRGLTQKYKI
jgi:hypothetical protein